MSEVEELLPGNIQRLRFMERADLIDMAITLKAHRDVISDYNDTVLASFIRNPLIVAYLEVIDVIDFLIDNIMDEVTALGAQIAEDEDREGRENLQKQKAKEKKSDAIRRKKPVRRVVHKNRRKKV